MSIKYSLRTRHGFTIVELLIVIVIIAVLAAITVVAYTGLTNRADSASAQSTASNIAKKVEAYNTEQGSYPTTYAALSADSTRTWYVAPGTATLVATALSSPTDEKSINYANCVTPTGKRISYWKFDGTPGIQHLYIGGATSASTCTLSTT